LVLTILFGTRLAAAILPGASFPLSLLPSRGGLINSRFRPTAADLGRCAPFPSGAPGASKGSRTGGPAGAGGGARMCGPVPTPVDPMLAMVLARLCVGRVLHDLERLGVGPPRGGSSRVVYSGETVRPHRRAGLGVAKSLPAAARLGMRRLRTAAVRPAGELGTATLLRSAAVETVCIAWLARSLFSPRHVWTDCATL
jgi:hypothetical protein